MQRLWNLVLLLLAWSTVAGAQPTKRSEIPSVVSSVAISGDGVIGSVMAGYDGHRGWVNYLAVSPHARRGGIGRALMSEVELRLRGAGCPKINLQFRATNQAALGFYRALGYSTDDVISLGRRLEDDT